MILLMDNLIEEIRQWDDSLLVTVICLEKRWDQSIRVRVIIILTAIFFFLKKCSDGSGRRSEATGQQNIFQYISTSSLDKS